MADYESRHTGLEIDDAVDDVATKSTVSVSATGTATDQVQYITIDGVEKKLAGGTEAAWGSITGDIDDQEDLQEVLAEKQSKFFHQTTEPTTAVEGDIWSTPGGPGTGDGYVVSGTVTGNTLSMANSDGSTTNFSPTYTKTDVGLANVDNTSDADKPISTATQTALNEKSTVSVSETGTATDEVSYITVNGVEKKLPSGGSGAVWGGITGTMSDQTDLNTALGEKAPQATTYTKTEVDTALGGKVSTDALKDTIRDLFYPVGSHYIQIDSITPATRFGGTWEVDTTYNGKALWCDSTKTVGTAIAQALPKPTLTFTGSSATTGGGSAHTHTFTGSSATSGTQSANHTHTFTGSSVSTASNGSHTHTRGTMEIKGEARFSCVGDNGIHTKSGALNDSSYYKNDWGRKYESANYTSTGILNFTASNNWTGETSNNGSHSHTVTAAGSIGNNSVSHTHTVTAKGSNSSESSHTHSVTAKGSVTCNTAGAYGDGTTVQPPAISVIVWKRTA